MNGGATEVWRWEGNTDWHYFCSMSYAAAQAREAANPFMRYHAIRTCVYFAVATIEAHLNLWMRIKLESDGISEAGVWKRLRTTKLDDKIDKWPTEICGRRTEIASEIRAVLEQYKALRDEVTHPKRRDHSVLVDLEKADPDGLADAVARSIVTIAEGKGEPFQYWVLGWNYTGMNGDPSYPCQLNNGNAFIYSLKGMDLPADPFEIDWDKRNMASISDYERIKLQLDDYEFDIEPYWVGMPSRPRLTRRWWDREYLMGQYNEALQISGDDPKSL